MFILQYLYLLLVYYCVWLDQYFSELFFLWPQFLQLLTFNPGCFFLLNFNIHFCLFVSSEVNYNGWVPYVIPQLLYLHPFFYPLKYWEWLTALNSKTAQWYLLTKSLRVLFSLYLSHINFIIYLLVSLHSEIGL